MKLPITLLLLLVLMVGYASAQARKDPCGNAQTQAEMNDCAGRQYKRADAELNQVYQKLVALLDNGEKAQLKAVETAWIRYRDANCDFVGDQYKGGTIRPMIQGLCLADMTNNRTTELRSQIQDRSR